MVGANCSGVGCEKGFCGTGAGGASVGVPDGQSGRHYGADAASPYALPIKAASLKGLPPATIIAAEIDPLLSEGVAYADKLRKDGVSVTYKEYKGVAHEFFGMGAAVPKAKEAEQFAADQLKKAFAAKH